MPMVFPTSPTVGQVFSSGGRSWVWNGSTWDSPRTDNPPLAIPTGNVIINGGFDIWQRGTTFNNIAGSAYFADRWLMGFKDAGLTLNVSRQSFTPGSAPVAGVEGEFFARFATTAFSTNNTYYFGQKIEDVRTFAGQTVTLSYWARVSSGTLTPSRLFLNQQFGSGGSGETDNIGSHNPSYTTTWQRFTQTIAVPSISGKTIGTGSNLWVLWQITPNANVSLDIWGVQLEAGTVATPFRRNAPSIQAELAACQRYYFRFGGSSVNQRYGLGAFFTSTTAQILVTHPVPMRINATSIDFALLNIWDYGQNYAVTGITFDAQGLQSTNLNCTVGGGTQYRPVQLTSASSFNGFLGLSAEL